MPQLLLELLSEEILFARMQPGAQRDLERMARERLTAVQLPFERLRAAARPAPADTGGGWPAGRSG